MGEPSSSSAASDLDRWHLVEGETEVETKVHSLTLSRWIFLIKYHYRLRYLQYIFVVTGNLLRDSSKPLRQSAQTVLKDQFTRPHFDNRLASRHNSWINLVRKLFNIRRWQLWWSHVGHHLQTIASSRLHACSKHLV